jgi:hypothetical protein
MSRCPDRRLSFIPSVDAAAVAEVVIAMVPTRAGDRRRVT